MTSVSNLFDQQYGNRRWKFYDDVLKRLQCSLKEQYSDLVPNDADGNCCDTPIFSCKFAQKQGNETVVAFASEDGRLGMHDISNNEERYGIKAHDNAIFDIAWMFGNMKIVTASGDHTARLFDITPGGITQVKVFFGHSRSVKTVAFRRADPSVFATGGRDGNIVVWDSRSDYATNFLCKAERTISNSHNGGPPIIKSGSNAKKKGVGRHQSAKSVTGLVFQDDYTLISCGAGDGFIKIWDLRKNYVTYKHGPMPKYKISYSGSTSKNGFSSILLDDSCFKLYANCLDNTIYCYNLSTYNSQPMMKYVGHQNSTFYIKSALSSDGNYLISGSSDEKAYIWNITQSDPLLKLVGHCAEVTCVAWCPNKLSVVTCSDDMTHKIWKIGTEELPDNWEINLKGRTETLPMITQRPTMKLKRIHKSCETMKSDKKLISICERCRNVVNTTTQDICENCQNLKRKSNDDDDDDDEELDRANPFNPRRLFSELTNIKEELTDLPNFVVDGTAPHLVYSPPKKKKQDWLTLMRTERKLRRHMEELACPSASKMPKLESSPSWRSPQSRKPCNSPKHSPIMRFFKVTNSNGNNCKNNNNNNNNGSCGLISSPKSSQ